MKTKERIDNLCDLNTFFEINAFAQSLCKDFGMEKNAIPGDGVITGLGQIDRRNVLIYAQDATILGGSVGLTHAIKIRNLLNMARTIKIPIIGLNESVGGRIQEGIDTIAGYSKIFYENIQCSGIIPQISAIFGTCAGGAVYSPALTDFIFMIENESKMFITGPITLESVTGEKTTKEELGGAKVHGSISGVADFVCKDELDCLIKIRKLLSFLPSNNEEKAPVSNSDDDPTREDDHLDSIVPVNPKKPYDMRSILESIIDKGDFFEVKSLFAPNIITGFGRLNGRSVGIIANQPSFLAGAIDINASIKAARFIRFCDCFNIPIISFVDTPAYLPGVKQEHNGIIRHGAKMLFAFGEATVPKICIILRKGYGGGNPAMCNKDMGADFVFAWPTAEIAVLGAEAAIEILFKKEIGDSNNPEQIRQEKFHEYRRMFANPYHAAKKQYIDAIIEPKKTRQILIKLLEFLQSKNEKIQTRKHGNIPL
jgi:acetyl-CoA carboxylase carboxyltransferase component